MRRIRRTDSLRSAVGAALASVVLCANGGSEPAKAPHPLAGTWTLSQRADDPDTCAFEIRINETATSLRSSDGKSVIDDRAEVTNVPGEAGLYRLATERVSATGGGGCLRTDVPDPPHRVSRVVARTLETFYLCEGERDFHACTGPFRRDVQSLARELALGRATFPQAVMAAVAPSFWREDMELNVADDARSAPVIMTSDASAESFPCERLAAFDVATPRGALRSHWQVADCRDVAGLRVAWARSYALAEAFFGHLASSPPQDPFAVSMRPVHRPTPDGGDLWIATNVLLGHGPVALTSAVWIDATGKRAVVVQTGAMNSCWQHPAEAFCGRLHEQVESVVLTAARLEVR